MQLSLFTPDGPPDTEPHSLEKEERLYQEWDDVFNSFATKEEERAAWDRYEAEYSKRKVDWTGFQEYQAVRVDDGRTGVITVLGLHGCGLIEVDLERRLLLGHIHDASTPDRLTPLKVEAALAAELTVLVKRVHRKSGGVHRAEDLLAQYLPTWSKGANR